METQKRRRVVTSLGKEIALFILKAKFTAKLHASQKV